MKKIDKDASFLAVPYSVLARSDLSVAEKLVYAARLSYRGQYFEHRDTLAKRLGMPRSTVFRAIKKLSALGLWPDDTRHEVTNGSNWEASTKESQNETYKMESQNETYKMESQNETLNYKSQNETYKMESQNETLNYKSQNETSESPKMRLQKSQNGTYKNPSVIGETEVLLDNDKIIDKNAENTKDTKDTMNTIDKDSKEKLRSKFKNFISESITKKSVSNGSVVGVVHKSPSVAPLRPAPAVTVPAMRPVSGKPLTLSQMKEANFQAIVSGKKPPFSPTDLGMVG